MPVLLTKHHPSHVTDVEEELRRRLRSAERGTFLSIVPTKRKVRELQRDLLKVVPEGVAPLLPLFTLETLAAELYGLCCPPRRLVSGPLQAVLMHNAIRSVEGTLAYFTVRRGSRGLAQGTFQKILDGINHLKERGVYRSALYAELGAAEAGEQAKLRDLLAIYDAYERALGEEYIDAAGVMKELNMRWEPAAAGSRFFERYGACRTLFISGFDEFSDPELTMIGLLSDLPGLGTIVSFDYHLENDDVFGHLKENYRKLLAMGFEKTSGAKGPGTSFQEYIAARLFRTRDRAARLPCRERVSLIAAEDREHEVELIARRIKLLAHEQPGLDLSTVCVSMYQPQLYTALFREVFARYGIPANITDRYQLDQSPLVIAVLSLLELQQRNFRLADLMRALSTPYFDISSPEGAVDAGNLYATAVALKISSGKKNWFGRMAERLASLAEEETGAEEEGERLMISRERGMLRNARRDLERIAELTGRFAGRMTPGEFVARLRSLLAELRIVERIVAAPGLSTYEIERDARAYRHLIGTVDEQLELLNLEGEKEAPRPLSFYVERLKVSITQVRYNVRQKYGYGVYVTSFSETRGLAFDVMFIAGLAAGEFPPKYAREFLFSAARQQRYERTHLGEHRYLFYQALTNCRSHVYLSYPLRDGDSEVVPSPFVDALCDAVEPDDCRGGLPEALGDVLCSEEELLMRAGAHPEEEEALRASVPPGLSELLGHMRRAIGVEQSRRTGGPMPEYSGVISAPLRADARAALERFRRHVYSATQLELYGGCPFRFFAARVLRLNVTKIPDEGLSPLERGSVLHDILFEFYTRRRDEGKGPLHLLGDEESRTALGELLQIAREKLDALTPSGVFWEVEKEQLLGTEARTGLLREFFDAERGRAFETSPAFFEAAFGGAGGKGRNTDRTLRLTAPIDLNGVQLRGKVDRVDTGEEIFTVIDYKSTARSFKRSDIESGMSLQLPLYLYAVEYMLSALHGKTMRGVGGIYYKLRTPVEEQLGLGSREYAGRAFAARGDNRQLTADEEELRGVIGKAVAFVNDYVDSIARGMFPVAPKDRASLCAHCDFISVCRIQQTGPARPLHP